MVDLYGKLVGKYTVRPMDPMGLSQKKRMVSHWSMSIPWISCDVYHLGHCISKWEVKVITMSTDITLPETNISPENTRSQ